jgi:hypothetical protein
MKLIIPLILASILTLSGCGGFRSGFASVPYIGDVEPISEEKFFEFYDYSLALPGIKLFADINNRIRTRDIAVMLFVVPISIDLINKPYYKDTDRMKITLKIIPTEPGFDFKPSEVTAAVDGQSLNPAITYLQDTEKRVEFWKSSDGRTLSDYDKLSSVIDKEMPLIKDKYYTFDMIFDRPVPTPDKTITLNIGKALTHPQHPTIPKIRFKKIRWKQSYT